MNIGFLITARLKSTRLPNKLLLKIFDREIIRWMIDRLKLSSELNKIIICTSTNSQDDTLISIANEEGVDIFRGSEDDVLQRLYDASVFFKLDYIVNVTADCPLVSLEYISEIIKTYERTDADLLRCLELPHGFFSYGIKVEALKRVCEIKGSENTEVWGRYFTETGLFNVIDLKIPLEIQRPNYRLTLDYQEDFTFFEQVFFALGPEAYKKSIYEILSLLDNHNEIVAINSNCKYAFKKNWDSQNTLKIKNE